MWMCLLGGVSLISVLVLYTAIKTVAAAYAVSREFDVCSKSAGMEFYNKVLGLNHFQSRLSFFLFCLML